MTGVWTDIRAALGLEPGRPTRPPQRGPKHAPRVPFALLVVTLITGGLGVLLLLNTVSAANEVRRHNLAGRDASVAAQVQELQNEVAASAAPGNLAQAAGALGMVPAGNPAFLVVGPDGSVRVMGSPAPASGMVLAQQNPPKHTTPKKKKSASASAKKSPGKTSRSSKTSTSATTSKTSSKSSAHNKPAPHPSPTPTPTPTLILPGGNR
jgi:hypothetical protein